MNYYNEFDPYAAQWLRNLIAEGLIPNGHVDERSITDVKPRDLEGFIQCHFFAGIGGWPLALKLAGWPATRPVWTGSCPCQPFAAAGKKTRQQDERHLWPDWRRLICERRPAEIFGEQVDDAITAGWLDDAFNDLETEAYSCAAAILPACGVGAPHRRDRIFFVAHTESGRGGSGLRQGGPQRDGAISGNGGGNVDVADATSRGLGTNGRPEKEGWPDSDGHFDVGDASRDVVHTDSGRRAPGYLAPEAPRHRDPAAPDGSHVVDSFQSRLEGHPGHGDGGREPGRVDAIEDRSIAPTSAWGSAGWIEGHDGKTRRIEPSIRLLAHGVPARVGKLRAFGNAIVPQAASEFIRAYLDA